MTGKEIITLCAVGDVAPDRDNPESIFELAAPALRASDISFCQLERVLSLRGAGQGRTGSHHSCVDPKNVAALAYAGFKVVSFASNHSLDGGEEGLLDTMDCLAAHGMLALGVGRDVEEARRPVLIKIKGVSIAFLGYCSVLPQGYEAAAGRPGCAPLRAHTSYEQIDWQAGTPPKIITSTYPQDLAAMVEDIRKVRPFADVVIVSAHWGVHFVPEVIALYQIEIARAAIDAGADLILGHHAHILKGVDVYRGKAIFYSMGNFAFDIPARFVLSSPGYQKMRERYPWDVDPDYAGYGYPAESWKTMVVKVLISDRRIEKVSFLPALINRNAQPEILQADDRRFDDVVAYMERITRNEKLSGQFAVEGDEVVINAVS